MIVCFIAERTGLSDLGGGGKARAEARPHVPEHRAGGSAIAVQETVA